jgi:putative ABC transport system permease protein
VAALVGVIGVVNAQLASVLDRSREIAMIRTIGVSARSIVRAVILECGAIGALGGVAGALLGALLGAQALGVGLRLATGWRMPFEVPVGPILSSVVIALFVSAVAGYVPARAAARMTARQQSLD